MSFVAATLLSFVLAKSQPANQTPPPQKIWPGFGVNIHFTEPKQNELPLLRATGVTYVRTDLFWNDTEKSTGHYDFTVYDRLLGRLKQGHIRPMFVLDYGNDHHGRQAPKSSRDQQAYADWAAAAVTHFKGEEIVFELWNEPNVDQFWRPKANADEYASLALLAAKAMRAADPNVRIIAPGVSRIDMEFLRKSVSKELLGLIDGVSVHPYRAGGPETVMKDYEQIQNWIKATAPPGRENLPVVCSEWGYSTFTKSDVTEARQAMYVAKLWLLSAAAGCPVTIYYDWKDDGPSPANPEHRYGLVRQDLKMKPAFDAARFVTTAFKGCTVFKRMSKRDPLDWVIIGAGEGRLVRATWYQKIGTMPKFEEYDMSDKANRDLYNKIMDEANGTAGDKTPKTDQDPPTGTSNGGGSSNNANTNKPNNDKPSSDKPSASGDINKAALSNMTLSFAPPLDSEGWCAIIDKPSSVANSKFEFHYERKSSGAKVTCYALANGPRVCEPLADSDPQTIISALVGGRKIGDYSVAVMPIAAADLELRTAKGSSFESSAVIPTQSGASSAYLFAGNDITSYLAPKQPMAIPPGAKKFIIWIKSDFSGNKLSCRVADESGKSTTIDLGLLNDANDRNGWRAVVVNLADLGGSNLHWEALLAVEASDKRNLRSGTIEFGPAAYEY